MVEGGGVMRKWSKRQLPPACPKPFPAQQGSTEAPGEGCREPRHGQS